MAICQDCDQEMSEATGCDLATVPIDGTKVPRVPFGSERPRHPSRRCGDCNVERGRFHHLGCDVESCPACGWQLISCGCWTDGEDDDEDDVDAAEMIEEAIHEAWIAVDDAHRRRIAHRFTYCPRQA